MTTPAFKIHDAEGCYQAATRDAELAAAVVGLLGGGSRVKHGGRIIWREGAETISASDSYDLAAQTMLERINHRRFPATPAADAHLEAMRESNPDYR